MVFSGLGLSPVLPVTGTVMSTRAPYAADAVINIAAKDPRVLKALTQMLRYSAWAQLGMFGGVIGLAVAVDIGNIPPDHAIAQKLIGKEIEEVEKARERAIARAAAAGDNGQPRTPEWAAEPAAAG